MLYNRIVGEGTLNEPEGKPDPQWALPSTVNWMRAIRLLVDVPTLDFVAAKAFYAGEGRRSLNRHTENTIFEQLFLALHHLSALKQMSKVSPVADVARVGILCWYYGISNAASAMIAAQHGSFQEDHTGTSKMWDTCIAQNGLAMPPFDWRVSSLLEPTYKTEVVRYRSNNSASLLSRPESVDDAKDAAAAYLSGSAKWYAWRATEAVRATKDFKALGVKDFRTKAARELRDQRLSASGIGFVHQASRYRGKANYREALFLAYGSSTETHLSGFVEDQARVLEAFVTMAGAYAARKVGRVVWDEFTADVEAKRAFTTSAASVWM